MLQQLPHLPLWASSSPVRLALHANNRTSLCEMKPARANSSREWLRVSQWDQTDFHLFDNSFFFFFFFFSVGFKGNLSLLEIFVYFVPGG